MSQTATRAATRGAWPVERFDEPQQCAGYWVRDPRGRKIGKLKRLFLNGSGGAEYAEVKVGLFGMKTIRSRFRRSPSTSSGGSSYWSRGSSLQRATRAEYVIEHAISESLPSR